MCLAFGVETLDDVAARLADRARDAPPEGTRCQGARAEDAEVRSPTRVVGRERWPVQESCCAATMSISSCVGPDLLAGDAGPVITLPA